MIRKKIKNLFWYFDHLHPLIWILKRFWCAKRDFGKKIVTKKLLLSYFPNLSALQHAKNIKYKGIKDNTLSGKLQWVWKRCQVHYLPPKFSFLPPHGPWCKKVTAILRSHEAFNISHSFRYCNSQVKTGKHATKKCRITGPFLESIEMH